MTCKDIGLRLSASMDNELPSQEQRHVDEHLASCAACRRILDALVAARAAVHAVGDEAVSAHFDASLGRRLAKARSQGQRRQWLPVLVGGAAAAVVLLALGIIATREPTPAAVAPTRAVIAIPMDARPCLHCADLRVADRPCASRLSCGPDVPGFR